ncbi:uncharacterized protein LOC143174676 [Nomia melanderi]|uniref:uncharacterized protein LOC143174676 n=1 Tax=Nomia melanderi TaxID=2448451 RepID=UPI003FCCFD73
MRASMRKRNAGKFIRARRDRAHRRAHTYITTDDVCKRYKATRACSFAHARVHHFVQLFTDRRQSHSVFSPSTTFSGDRNSPCVTPWQLARRIPRTLSAFDPNGVTDDVELRLLGSITGS